MFKCDSPGCQVSSESAPGYLPANWLQFYHLTFCSWACLAVYAAQKDRDGEQVPHEEPDAEEQGVLEAALGATG